MLSIEYKYMYFQFAFWFKENNEDFFFWFLQTIFIFQSKIQFEILLYNFLLYIVERQGKNLIWFY